MQGLIASCCASIRNCYRVDDLSMDAENGEYEMAGRLLLFDRLNMAPCNRYAPNSSPNTNHVTAIWKHRVSKATLYVGNYIAAEDSAFLLSLNIKSIVNCTRPSLTGRGELPNYHESFPYNFRYLDFPIARWRAMVSQDESILEFFVGLFSFIEESLERGESVLLHCLAGAHRAGTAGIASLMYFAKMDKDDATAACKFLRPIIDPIGSLLNCLELLEKDLSSFFAGHHASECDGVRLSISNEDLDDELLSLTSSVQVPCRQMYNSYVASRTPLPSSSLHSRFSFYPVPCSTFAQRPLEDNTVISPVRDKTVATTRIRSSYSSWWFWGANPSRIAPMRSGYVSEGIESEPIDTHKQVTKPERVTRGSSSGFVNYAKSQRNENHTSCGTDGESNGSMPSRWPLVGGIWQYFGGHARISDTMSSDSRALLSTSSNPSSLHINQQQQSQPSQLQQQQSTNDDNYDSESKDIHATATNQPRYTTWIGTHSFFCYGSCMMGPHTHYFAYSCLLITMTWITYLFLVVPFLHSVNCFIIGLVLWTINITSLYLTGFTEPGIIPPRQSNRLMLSMDYEIKTKLPNYCSVCNIIRSKRAKHCRICNACCEEFDHHCPWTGTCIGARNYAFFFILVLSVFIGAVFILYSITSLLIGWMRQMPTDQPLLRCIVVSVMCTWSLAVVVLVGLLLMFHIYLICHGQTTHEFLRSTPSRNSSPKHSNNSNHQVFHRLFKTISTLLCLRTQLLPMWKPLTDIDKELDIINSEAVLASLRRSL